MLLSQKLPRHLIFRASLKVWYIIESYVNETELTNKVLCEGFLMEARTNTCNQTHSLESVDNVRYNWTLVQIITHFVMRVTFLLATTYDPPLNGEPRFHSTWRTVLKIWTRLFWIGQGKAIEAAIYKKKTSKSDRNKSVGKLYFLFFSLIVLICKLTDAKQILMVLMLDCWCWYIG